MAMSDSVERVRRLVIVGGGTAGWMAAAALSDHLRRSGTEITLIESSKIGTVGVGEATTPTIRRFYGGLGVTDQELMRRTNATCKLAIRFSHWRKQGDDFFHPFALFGHDVKQVAFHHFWMKMKMLGDNSELGDYSLGLNLARQARFSPPPSQPESPLSVFDWALHFDAGLFAGVMREIAEANGVKRHDAAITQVKLRKDDGFIESLVLETGVTVPGDLFIDCSGFRGLLIEETLKTGYEDWAQWMPCDRALAVASRRTGEVKPYTEAIAHSAGWQWRIPLQTRQGNGHVYSSRHLSDDEALAVLRRHLDGELLSEPRLITFKPGRRKKAWNRNCIALGLSAGFIEPLESTSIALIETGIEKIKMLFPDRAMKQGNIDEFNAITQMEYERVRDFIILHYCATERTDSALWRECRSMEVPETLAHKIRLFRDRGHLVKYPWEMFRSSSWLALFIGYGIFPETYDPMVDNFDTDYIRRSLAEMRRSIAAAVQATPPHETFLSRVGGVGSPR